MRRFAWLLAVSIGCSPPIGPAPEAPREPVVRTRPAEERCEALPEPTWEHAIVRMPALAEHTQLDRARERFETLRTSWFADERRIRVWLRAEGAGACVPLPVHLTHEAIDGRDKTDVVEGEQRTQSTLRAVIDPWGISAWSYRRQGRAEADGWAWEPFDHGTPALHTGRYLSSIDERVAVFGGSSYRLTTTCVEREVRAQTCESGTFRRCPVCTSLGLRRIGHARSRAHRLRPPAAYVEDALVDCAQSCPNPWPEHREAIEQVLGGRVFYDDDGDGVRMYRRREDCLADTTGPRQAPGG